jgi:hypothetical protein
MPEPEENIEVPSKYCYLIGEHSPHPGTGKGNSYSKKQKHIDKKDKMYYKGLWEMK